MKNKFFELDKSEQESLNQVPSYEYDPATNERLMKEWHQIYEAKAYNAEIQQELAAFVDETLSQLYDATEDNYRYINTESGINGKSYSLLRAAGRTIIPQMIKNVRKPEISQYARVPKEHEIQRGFKLELINYKKNPTERQKADLDFWTHKIVNNCFFAPNDKEPNFSKFLNASYDTDLDLDDITIEYIRDGLKRPIGIQLQDSILFKHVRRERKYSNLLYKDEIDILEEGLKNYEVFIDGDKKLKETFEKRIPDYVLIYNNHKKGYFDTDQIYKYHHNTRPEYSMTQRGFSQIEQSLVVIEWIMNTLLKNSSNFTTKKFPDGLLAIIGKGFGKLDLIKLKKAMRANINGTTNDNQVPAFHMTEGDLKWLNFMPSSKDVEYHIWFTLLVTIFCKNTFTDPRELGFATHSDTVRTQTMNTPAVDGVVKEAAQQATINHLNKMTNLLNRPFSDGRNIFQHITGMDVQGAFFGYEIEDKKLKAEINTKELETTASLNKLLANNDEDKYELIVELGEGRKVNVYDIPGINNSNIFNLINSQIQMAAQRNLQQSQELQGQDENTPEDQLNEEDLDLINQYGADPNVEIDDKLKEMMNQENEEEIDD